MISLYPKLQLKNYQDIYFACVLLFIALLPFHFKISNLAIGLLVLVWIYGAVTRKIKLSLALFSITSVLFLLIFIFHVIGLFYSNHVLNGFRTIEILLPFLIFPAILHPLKNTNSKRLRTILHVFVLTCLFASFIAIGGALMKTIGLQSFYTFNPNTKVNEYHFFYHQLTDHIGIHAVYFGLYIAFSHLIVLQRVLNKFNSHNKFVKGYLIFLILYFPLILYLTQSLIIILGWGLCFVMLILQQLTSTKGFIRNKRVLLLLFFISLPIITTVGYKTVKDKINLSTIGKFNYSDGAHSGNWGTLNIRLAKWSCASEVFLENFWTGTGTGDAHNTLYKKYEEKEFWLGLQNKFDPHNQFLMFGITLGIFSVTLFCITLLWLLAIGIKSKNILFISFITLFTLFSITESTLASNKGIVFFVFFSLYFDVYSKNWKKEESDSSFDNYLPDRAIY